MSGQILPLTRLVGNKLRRFNDHVVLHIAPSSQSTAEFNRILKKIFYGAVWVSLPYSSEKAKKADCPVYSASWEYGVYVIKRNGCAYRSEGCSFDEAAELMIYDALTNELLRYAEHGKKIIVIDNGGYHYGIIGRAAREYPLLAGSIVGAAESDIVGARLAAMRSGPCYPVIGTARSDYNMRYASCFAAQSIINAVDGVLSDIGDFADFKSFLVIGYGIFGRQIALKLRSRSAHIRIHDTNEKRLFAAAAEGFDIWDGKFRRNDIIIGASGSDSFTCNMMRSFLSSPCEQICLISASSGQKEFSGVMGLLENCAAQKQGNISMYKYEKNKTVAIAADGLPVNYASGADYAPSCGTEDPVFTETLLLAALLCGSEPHLDNKLYMLGSGEAPDNAVREDIIIRMWAERNGIDIYSQKSPYYIHPCEDALRKI